MSRAIVLAATLLAALTIIHFAPAVLSDLAPASNISKDPPKTVPYVDVAKYLGGWYEQATIPYFFERNCERTKATYSLNTDGTVRVDNLCYRNGVKHESVGKAFPDPADTEKTNAKLKVEFVSTLDIEANYWIVRLDKDYTYSVVSSPSYNYLWILYRDPQMPETLYQAIYQDLKANGFPVEKLKRTVQI
jgi:apolipoprotein D and lipocalin family protein